MSMFRHLHRKFGRSESSNGSNIIGLKSTVTSTFERLATGYEKHNTKIRVTTATLTMIGVGSASYCADGDMVEALLCAVPCAAVVTFLSEFAAVGLFFGAAGAALTLPIYVGGNLCRLVSNKQRSVITK